MIIVIAPECGKMVFLMSSSVKSVSFERSICGKWELLLGLFECAFFVNMVLLDEEVLGLNPFEAHSGCPLLLGSHLITKYQVDKWIS